MHERIASARATLGPKLTAFSKLRKISLNRLEQVIVAHQGTLTDEMRYLAGLQRVRYVFYYPDSKDIVLAGPAEGWATDLAGRIVGSTRPARRRSCRTWSWPCERSRRRQATASDDRLLDRSDAGRAWPRMQQFLRNVGSQADSNANRSRSSAACATASGLQIMTHRRRFAETHFAQVMVEADYRMKLIGIGLETPPVKMVSYVDRAEPARGAATPCNAGSSCPTTSASG